MDKRLAKYELTKDHMKQIEIAKILGISPSFLCEVLKGEKRFSAKKVKIFSERFKLDPLILLFGDKVELSAELDRLVRLKRIIGIG